MANREENFRRLLAAGAGPRATNRLGTTFQTYLDRAPTNIMTEDARRQREAIEAWVRDSSGSR